MISSVLRHTALAALALSALALGGCSGSGDEEPEQESNMVLRLRVQLAGESSGSRAAGDPDNIVAGGNTPFEALSQMRVIILRPDHTVEGNRLVQTDGTGKPVNDNLEFTVRANQVKTIYVIANESALSLPAGVDASHYPTVTDWLNSYLPVIIPTDESPTFPMDVMSRWIVTVPGYTETDSEEIFQGAAHLPATEMFYVLASRIEALNSPSGDTQTSDLFMTRAAAKVTFNFDFSSYGDGAPGEITGVRINGLNRAQYVFPNSTTYSPAKYIGDETDGAVNGEGNDIRTITSFAVPRSATYDFTPDIETVPAAYSTRPITRGPYYIPESLASEPVPYSVSVKFGEGGWLNARPLQDNMLELGGYQGIPRSSHVVINIRFSPVDITWQAVEAPYNTIVLDPWFGLE